MKVFASIRLTVFCLFWLGVLTFFGTLYQTEHGIYLAQERYFHSMIWMLGGLIPLPGGLLTMGTLFLNLSVSLFHHNQAGLRMPVSGYRLAGTGWRGCPLAAAARLP